MTDPYRQRQEDIRPQRQAQPGEETGMYPRPLFIREGYRGSGRLAGRVALITGGDSGIGRSIAVHFAREGADVAIVYLEEHDDAAETRELVSREGRDCLLIAGDVGDEAFCARCVEQTAQHYGRLNILVNNAGEQHSESRFEDISGEQIRETFRTNIFAYFYLAQHALKHLEGDGTIINTTSITAYRGSAHLIDYSATKGAIVSFTRSLAQALVKRGVRVNAVAPGPIWTPLIPATFPKEKVGQFGANTPMERAGQPSEVGPAYVFLASEDASYMTGQVLHANGGDFLTT